MYSIHVLANMSLKGMAHTLDDYIWYWIIYYTHMYICHASILRCILFHLFNRFISISYHTSLVWEWMQWDSKWIFTIRRNVWFAILRHYALCMQAQIAKLMGPTWGPPWSSRPQIGPCWPHEPCYQGGNPCANIIYMKYGVASILHLFIWIR